VGGKSYPIPLRVLSFEHAVKAHDPEYKLPAADTYARRLRKRFEDALSTSRSVAPLSGNGEPSVENGVPSPLFHEVILEDGNTEDRPEDALETYVSAAISTLSKDTTLLDRVKRSGIPWMGVQSALISALPDVIEESERSKIAYANVPRAMDLLFGVGKWDREKRPSKSTSGTTLWLVLKTKPPQNAE
jgi:hypothetical protein